MILTGAKLEELGKVLYGDIWLSMLARKLGRSKKTVMRWTKSPAGFDMAMRQQLIDLIDEQYRVLGKWRSDLSAAWDDA